MIFGRKKKSDDRERGAFRCNVSDVLDVPLRGVMLKLRVIEGEPDIAAFSPGRRLRLIGPDEREHVVTIKAYSVTTGRPNQGRLDKAHTIDLVIPGDQAVVDGQPIRIGWHAVGPVDGDDRAHGEARAVDRERRPYGLEGPGAQREGRTETGS